MTELPSESPGGTTHAETVIIGGGPAGLTAAVYLSRAMVNAVLVEAKALGGNALTAGTIENYPGFEQISGPELIEHMVRQAGKLRLPVVYETVHSLYGAAGALEVRTATRTIHVPTAIIAAGTVYRRLGVPGEAEYVGRGVSYCASCDGMFYRDKVIAVVGGGDSALKELVYLAGLARKVYLIHRREVLRGERVIQERIRQLGNVELLLSKTVVEILGRSRVETVAVRDVSGGPTHKLDVDGIFINIGNMPATGFVQGFLELDESGYIVTDRELRTSVKGIFAAGDVRAGEQRQIATAVGDGARAAAMVEIFLGRR